jgi:hypothetical protein
MRVTWNGRMIVAIISTNMPLRPGKRNRLKPYATQMADATAPMVESAEMAKVLKKSRGKSIVSQATAKLPKLRSNAQCCSRVRHRPTHVIGPASTLAGSMKMLSSRWASIRARARMPSSIGTS